MSGDDISIKLYANDLSALSETSERIAEALRGVDGRLYAWGFSYRPGMALLADSAAGRCCGRPAGENRGDTSIYGVGDLCGNVREILSPAPGEKLYRVIGGSWKTPPRLATGNAIQYTADGDDDIGFRIVIEAPAKPEE